MQQMNKTIGNIIASLLLQLVTIICGFITPRLILNTFGSEVNGLINSITQFLSYITLFEGGLNAVLLASLYEPIHYGKREMVSAIAVAAKKFYNKLAWAFFAYTAGLSLIYPFLVRTGFSWTYVVTLTWILSISLFCQYCFAIVSRTLLRSMQQVALVSVIQIVVVVLNTILAVGMIRFYPHVHWVKLVSSLGFVLQPILYDYFLDKKISLDKSAAPDDTALVQRWSGFSINMAAFIHDNTDIIILTFFSTLSDVSIYSVYFLVTTGLKRLIQSISAGIIPTLGRHYVSGDQRLLENTFKLYEFIIFFSTYLLFTVGGLTITPFVQLYTRGIQDADYTQYMLGFFLIMAEGIFCLREPYVNMAYSANRFKDIKNYAYAEAVINIVISLLLVRRYGFLGVALATAIAMAYRTVMQVIFLRREILHRSMGIFVRNIVVFSIGCGICVLCSRWILNFRDITVVSWVRYAAGNFCLALVIFSLISIVLFRNEMRQFVGLILRK